MSSRAGLERTGQSPHCALRGWWQATPRQPWPTNKLCRCPLWHHRRTDDGGVASAAARCDAQGQCSARQATVADRRTRPGFRVARAGECKLTFVWAVPTISAAPPETTSFCFSAGSTGLATSIGMDDLRRRLWRFRRSLRPHPRPPRPLRVSNALSRCSGHLAGTAPAARWLAPEFGERLDGAVKRVGFASTVPRRRSVLAGRGSVSA